MAPGSFFAKALWPLHHLQLRVLLYHSLMAFARLRDSRLIYLYLPRSSALALRHSVG